MTFAALIEELPPESRLALAYSPTAARADTLAVLALDARLARIVSQRREPVLCQMRLAWWRDQLGGKPSAQAEADPLVAHFTGWAAQRAGLAGLVDGWELLLQEPPLPIAAVEGFADGRAQAFAALAEKLAFSRCVDEAIRAARGWALADLASKITDPAETAMILQLVKNEDWHRPSLPRGLRALAVLHGLAARKQGQEPLLARPGDAVVAMRLGLFGR